MIGTAKDVFLAGDDTTTALYNNVGRERRGSHTVPAGCAELRRGQGGQRKEKEKEMMNRPSPKSPSKGFAAHHLL
jgi:hypothetical protein